MKVTSKYAACDHLPKELPKIPISEELRQSLARNFRVLPIYEKALADHQFARAHSVRDNPRLACRWREHRRARDGSQREPFHFPSVNDFHFYNFDTCYKPSQSLAARVDNRLTMKNGPGVDRYGEIPLPCDAAKDYSKMDAGAARGKTTATDKVKPKIKKVVKKR